MLHLELVGCIQGNHGHSTVHWLSIDSAIIKIFIQSSKIPKIDIEIRGQANGLQRLRRVSRSWHFSISTISRLWEKYHHKCTMMNVHLIHLQHYLNKLYYRYDCMHICRVWQELLKHFFLNITHCSDCCVGGLLQYIL